MEAQTSLDIPLLRESLGEVIRGKSEAVDLLLMGILGGGHVLLEDVPGVGKTTLGKALARCFGADFSRVQFTPDLLPADVIGSQVLDPTTGEFSFHRGPIFSHVLLADEINRASPRTQSALLEAMNEYQVTVDGITHPLPDPFCVIATQNPFGFQGTYPLPESQLDRFTLSFGLGPPEKEVELEILYAHQHGEPLTRLTPTATVKDWIRARDQVRDVRVERDVATWLLHVVDATRRNPEIELGISTRGALAWFRSGQARAFLEGRSYVSPDDLQRIAEPVLAHRLGLAAESRYGGKSAASLLAELLEEVPLPI